MEPYRAFIADKLPPSQLGKGFLAQSFFTGFGITLANVSLFVFQTLIEGATAAGIPYWVVGSFMLGSVCSIATVLVSVITTPEIPPTEAELAALREHKGSALGSAHGDLGRYRRDADRAAQARRWSTCSSGTRMVCYWQYVSLSIASRSGAPPTPSPEVQRGGRVDRPGQRLVQHRHLLGGLPAGRLRPPAGRQVGAHRLPAARAVGLLIFAQLTNKYLMFIPIIGLGIAWASIMGVPYIMAVRMIPSTRYGVYMGIINMMIVIPMLIQTVTFGAIYTSTCSATTRPTRSSSPASCSAIAAVTMLWIKEPPIVRDVDEVLAMPAGH